MSLSLTPRSKRAAALLVAEGPDVTRESPRRLETSHPQNVEKYVSPAVHKTKHHQRTELVRYALRRTAWLS